MAKIAIVLATSRENGNTSALILEIAKLAGAIIFDLKDYRILPYDYEHTNRGDDFLNLISELLTFERIVFASPVYWYSVCAQMKVFIDRLSDLVTIEKTLGRELRGKKVSLIATGNDRDIPECFEEPLHRTFNHLGMVFNGTFYMACDKNIEIDLARLKIDSYINNNFPIDSRIFSGS